MPAIRRTILWITVVLLAASTIAQESPPAAAKPAGKAVSIKAITANVAGEQTVIEVDSNHPLTPAIGAIENPRQIFIDLPNAVLSGHVKPVDFRSDEIAGIHFGQAGTQPPLTRVIIDLLQPLAYEWDSSHNQLRIHLRPKVASAAASSVPVAPPPVPSTVPETGGATFLNASLTGNGSTVTAGGSSRGLRLTRGGEIKLCPRTTLSVTPAKSGHDLLLGMSTGAIETNYALQASADSIVTPDFRMLLAGPGEFHFAISADAHGNTCVRSLPGNNASIIVTELIGDGSYQVKPEEEVVFRSGQLRLIDSKVPEDCGCPEPEPVNLAAAPPTPNAQPKTAPSTPVTAAVPANKPGEMQAEVDASMVFHGRPKAPAVPDAPTQEAENLPTGSHSADAIAATALPPPASAPVDSAAAKTSTHRSLLGRMASFFGRLFH